MHPIRSLALYEFLFSVGLGMTATTSTLLQLQVGMTISDIAFVNIIFWITIILMELPTGMLADGKSRIWSVRVGVVLYALGCFAYANVSGVSTALIAEIIIGVGAAFISGAEEAWIADALKNRGEGHLLARVFGTQAMAKASGILIGGFLGVYLGSWNLRFSWIGAGILVLASALVTCIYMDDSGESEERVTEYEALKLSCKALQVQPALIWSIVAAIIFGLCVSFNHLWQPFFVTTVGPTGLSWVWTVIQISLILAGWLVRRHGLLMGGGARAISFSILIAGVGLILLGHSSGLPAMLICVSFHELGRGIFSPIMSAYTQKRIESRFRATFGSLQSLLGKTGLALALLLVWFLSDGKGNSRETIVLIWTVAGTLLITGAILLWVFRPKEP